MKTLTRIVLFSACTYVIFGCGKSDIEEGVPIEDPSADAAAETTPPTPAELKAMKESQSE